MSTANKLTYLNVTKQKLKQAINNIGGEVTDETTFREYVNQLENAYDRLPKTEFEEGESVTLENTLKGKLDFQDGVVGIGQASQDTTTGKNKFAITVSLPITQNGITLSRDDNNNIMLNGTPTISSGSISFQVASNVIVNAGTYTMSIDNKINGVGVTYSDTTPAGALNLTLADTVNKRTATISAVNYGNFAINVRYDVGTLTNFIVNPQLESGSTATTYEQYTGGQASPNPSYPQEVKVVRGKNLLPNNATTQTISDVTFTINEDKSIKVNGIASANISYVLHSNISLKAGTYTLSGCPSGGSVSSYYLALAQLGISTPIIDTGSKHTKTLTETTSNLTYRIYIASGTNCNNLLFKPMLEKGSTATSYLPYNTINNKVENKNLFDGQLELGSIDKGLNISITTIRRSVNYISVIPNTNYIFSINSTANKVVVSFYDKNKTWINASGNDTGTLASNGTFTTPSNCYYMRFRCYATDFDLFETGNLMLEYGSTATTYVEHQEQNYPITTNAPLYSEDDYYYRDNGEWYVHNEWNKKVLNGSENWVNSGQFGYPNVFFVENLFDNISTSADRIMLSTHFTYGGAIESSALVELNKFYMWKTLPYRLILGINFTQVNEIKAWLVSNNVTILYQLQTPTNTKITDETLIEQLENWYNAQSYNGTTILEVDGDLPMIIKCRALKGES